MISRMRWHSILLAGFLAFASALALAQDQAFANRSTELKAKPAADGKTLATLNTDAPVYGGSGVGNYGGLNAEGIPAHGRAQSLNLNLPPLGALFLKSKEI